MKTGTTENAKNIPISEFSDSVQDLLYMILNPSFYEFTIQNIKMKNGRGKVLPLEELSETGMRKKKESKMLNLIRIEWEKLG